MFKIVPHFPKQNKSSCQYKNKKSLIMLNLFYCIQKIISKKKMKWIYKIGEIFYKFLSIISGELKKILISAAIRKIVWLSVMD
jgi:hypothetical protein